jgi:hypothetical protein
VSSFVPARLVSTFAVALAALGAAGLSAKTVDQSLAELQLGSKQLVGIWSCAGTGDAKPVSATIRWYHLEDGGLWMTLHPRPGGGAHPTLLEQWVWEDYSDTTGQRDWRTSPDPKSADQTSFTSQGPNFENRKMVWVRHAAQSTMSRTFIRLGADHLAFVEQFGAPPHVIYQLDCKRTLKREPPPQ